MYSIRRFCILVIMALTIGQAIGQSALEKANKQFDLGSYSTAIKSYQKILEKEPDNQKAIVRLADCYRVSNKMYDAENWYRKAAQSPKVEPSVYLNYGKVLMANNEYEKAKNWFQKYDSTDRVIANQFMKQCDFALQNRKLEPFFEISNEGFNSAAIEFGPIVFGNKLIYSSSRTDLKRSKKMEIEAFQGKFPNQLFYVTMAAGGRTTTPDFFRNDFTNTYNEGNLSISGDKQTAAFAKNSFADGVRIPCQLENSSIYLGELDKSGSMKNIEPFPFNGSSYSCVFPHLSADGTALFFSCNRPDGFGGYDLYVSKKSGKNWTAPQNLGSKVNTPGNEISPFLNNGKLYFSSDYHLGFGGQDIFYAEIKENTYANITHMGTGVNSSFDDFNYVYDNASDQGFFVSNRNFKNGEDIFRIRNLAKDLKILVLEKSSRKPLDAVSIEFLNPKLDAAKTDNFGQYAFQLFNPGLLTLRASKEGYEPVNKTINTRDLSDGLIELNLLKFTTFNTGVVLDVISKKPVEAVYVTALAEKSSEKIQQITDKDGVFSFSLKPTEVYQMKFSKVGYIEVAKTFENVQEGEKLGPIFVGTIGSEITNAKSKPAEKVAPTTKVVKSKPAEKVEVMAKNKATESGKWAIQLKSDSKEVDLGTYTKFSDLGNLYVVTENKLYKVRLGDFEDKKDADQALIKAKKLGIVGPFITSGRANSAKPQAEVAAAKPEVKPAANTAKPEVVEKTKEVYRIRLVAVKDTKNLDSTAISKIGTFNKTLTGSVFVVSVGPFPDLTTSKEALQKCIAIGYRQAYIEKQINGKFIKL